MSMERLPHFHRCCSHVNPFRQEIDSLKSEIKILVEVNERDYSDRSAAVRLADKEVVAIRAERDALAKEVERLKSDFTVDIDIMDAFKELFAIGAEYKVPEYILREWKIKWLERHLRFHNGKEDALKKDVDRLRSKLEVAREALERATHPHMDRFCIERARTALAQIGTSDEGA